MMVVNEGCKPCFEELLENEKKIVHSSEEAPQLEFKGDLSGSCDYQALSTYMDE